jgi:hypothetical protein
VGPHLPLTPPGPVVSVDPLAAGIGASEALWQRLAHPVDRHGALQALLGVPGRAIADLAHLLVAGGPEADALLDGTASTMRVLRNTTSKRPETRRGEVTGPIMWAETLSARAASFGADDVFVCATAFRDFDIAENRVLAYSLTRIVAAAGEVARMPGSLRDSDLGRAAQRNRDRAHRFLGQRGLRDARRVRPAARDVARTRGSRSVDTYRPALAMLERIEEPVRVTDLARLVDRRTRVQHAVLLSIIDELGRRGIEVPPFVVEGGGLRAGPLGYRHPGAAGPGGTGLHGILIGPVLVDVPLRLRDRDRVLARAALERRSGGRRCVIVLGPDDVSAAVAAALDAP